MAGRTRVWVKVGTERLSVASAARVFNISEMCLWNRLKRGVPKAELFAPGYGSHTGPRLSPKQRPPMVPKPKAQVVAPSSPPPSPPQQPHPYPKRDQSKAVPSKDLFLAACDGKLTGEEWLQAQMDVDKYG